MLSDYGHTAEDLVGFLEGIRELVNPNDRPFRVETARDLSYHRAINAFYFVLVLQRWQDDREGQYYSDRLPWTVRVYPDRSILTGNHEPVLWVCRTILGNQLKRVWSIRCEELVAEGQILPEQQKDLRYRFLLRPKDGCLDKESFQDKYRLLDF
ncbi:MAG: hypothetical protein JXQ73_14900 [Phycisphaerae bacterium]|nr:hypothetical protein [Phycisphaerae bacterium]